MEGEERIGSDGEDWELLKSKAFILPRYPPTHVSLEYFLVAIKQTAPAGAAHLLRWKIVFEIPPKLLFCNIASHLLYVVPKPNKTCWVRAQSCRQLITGKDGGGGRRSFSARRQTVPTQILSPPTAGHTKSALKSRANGKFHLQTNQKHLDNEKREKFLVEWEWEAHENKLKLSTSAGWDNLIKIAFVRMEKAIKYPLTRTFSPEELCAFDFEFIFGFELKASSLPCCDMTGHRFRSQ
jgi:hypothetical protein